MEFAEIKPLPIVAIGNDILKQNTVHVKTVEQAHAIIAQLKATLKPITTGVGLAAPQINSNLCAFIMKNGWSDVIIPVINPFILKGRDKVTRNEGCLSIPNVHGDVPERDKLIEVIFYDENLKKQRMKFDGFAANIFQHEYDHLHGILFTDRMTKEGREKIADQLAEIEKGSVKTTYDMIFSPQAIT